VNLPGYALEAYAKPCRHVGGDCLDYFNPDSRYLHLVLGDVSGKGLPSALYMVGVLSSLRAHVLDGIELDLLMTRLDRYVRSRFRSDHFLTLFVGRLEVESGVLSYCSAGHLPPLVFKRDGEVVRLEVTDAALNIVPGDEFHRFEYSMEPSDLFLVVTDGVTEAENPDGEQFGKERLIACVKENLTRDVFSIRREILARLEEFTAGRGFSDDVSMILLRRKSNPGGKRLPFGGARETYRGEIASRMEERQKAIDGILGHLQESGLDPDAYFDRLCLDEALTNAIVHGNREDPAKKVRFRVFRGEDRWAVEIEDEGIGFDWPAVKKKIEEGLDPARPSMRGLAAIILSGAEVDFKDGGRRMVMIRKT
jgi:anti-sigma regulatory factor (Ser/Thr protein kinase)